jgi:predicted methyltransferase
MTISTRLHAAVLVTLAACRPAAADTAEPSATPPTKDATPDAAKVSPADFAAVLAMPHRTASNRERDAFRHPAETLAFFGVERDDKVVELWPGGGWYTEILAPYLKDEGELTVTVFDPAGPASFYGTDQSKQLLARLAADPATFGTVKSAQIGQKLELDAAGKVTKTTIESLELAPAGSVDVVLTFRNSHGWYRNGALPLVYGAAFRALRPGGVFGVEQHRAKPDADPATTAQTGYMPEAAIIAAAEAAGFELAETSEINANPKDTKDHPDGVWSLPPRLSGGDKDKEKFLAIGESDRMTLKFVKPAG